MHRNYIDYNKIEAMCPKKDGVHDLSEFFRIIERPEVFQIVLFTFRLVVGKLIGLFKMKLFKLIYIYN